jgi:hypothetical protein
MEDQIMATRPMPIKRSWGATIGWALFALLALCGAVYMALQGPRLDYYLAILLLGIVGFAALLVASSGAYTTNCPLCDHKLKGLSGFTRCPQCYCYGKRVRGAYYELNLGFVSSYPALATPLGETGERSRMPPLCCVCCARATHAERMRAIRKGFALDLEVPYCEQHTQGADLDGERVLNESGDRERPVLKVRSYAFYRACIQANFPDRAKW